MPGASQDETGNPTKSSSSEVFAGDFAGDFARLGPRVFYDFAAGFVGHVWSYYKKLHKRPFVKYRKKERKMF